MIKNGYEHIPKENRKKILFLSDDIRTPSGIGTMSKQIVIGTAHKYNWVQIAGSIQHQEIGKILDMSKAVSDMSGVADPSVILYPTNGYGNPDLLRQVIAKEKPDALLHFTDPRFWIWLYNMEAEIRQNIPILYYNIWDDLPYPIYNENFYDSCDLLMGISKQTTNINKVVVGHKKKDWQIQYVPHGINEQDYFPIEFGTDSYNEMLKKKTQLFGTEEPKFVVLYNSRNIHRKMISDIMTSFQMFTDTLTPEDAGKCYLILHTQPIDDSGTNLLDVANKLTKSAKIIMHTARVTEAELNLMYNIADVTINISSAEGWGLGNTESLMAGTMTITNTTGGLQDQSRFVDENDKWIELTPEFPSNSCGKYKKCGEWTLPVFPQQNLVGSVPTPYIYDSRTNIKNVVERLIECYNMTREERKARGKAGHEWVTSDESMMSARKMCENVMKSIDTTFENFEPRIRYEMIDTKIKKIERPSGVYNPLTEKWY
jgi:hypothetical protein